jgi:hypothetical protein
MPDLSGCRFAPDRQPLVGRNPRVRAFLTAPRFGRQKRWQSGFKGRLGTTERHAILRPSGTCNAGLHVAEIEL